MLPKYYYSWWQLITGCTPISPGCKNCFGRMESKQLQEMGVPRYKEGFNFTIHETELERIHRFLEKVRKPCYFSLSPLADMLHENIPDEFILEVFRIMRKYAGCEFKIITKRSERLMELSYKMEKGVSFNVNIGVSVESPEQYYRIEHLRKTYKPNGGYKGLLISPLLGPMPDLPLHGISGVSCTDERGENARPAKKEWAADIKRQCSAAMEKFKYPIGFRSMIGIPLITPPHYYRFAMVTNLIESTGSLMAFMTSAHPRWEEYFALYSKYRPTPFPYEDLREKVRQVAPEFFEP